jgi:uncharacterized membrane protein YkoI
MVTTSSVVSTAAVTMVLGTGEFAAEKKVQLKDLPATVQKAMQAETKDGEILGYAEEREHGKVFYEVETKARGLTRDLLFDATGALVAVEQEVAPDALPAAVKAAFSASGKVLKVESITKGSTVTYEAQIQKKNGKKSEVVVDAAGKPVKP